MTQFLRHLNRCLSDINKFAREILHFKPTWQQQQLLDLVQYETFAPVELRKKGICVKSGQGPGKTAAVTICAAFRLLQRIGSKGLVTSPTARQVEDIWISEFQGWIGKAHPELQAMLDVQAKRIRVKGFKKWQINTATAVKPENMQGVHEENLTVVVDEASGIERKIWNTLKGTLTQPGNLLIAIGNPNDRDTEFFDMFNKDAALYHCLTWNAERSPNVDRRHIKRMADEYGVDSDVYRVRVLGEFPRESPNVVIRYEDLLHACRDKPFLSAFMEQNPADGHEPRKQFGIDLARFGSDESVIVARYNSAMVGKMQFSKREPSDVIEAAFRWQTELGWGADTIYCVDAGGMGQGVLSMFYENKKRVFEFHSQGTPQETQVYRDAVTEAYFNLRSMTRESRIHLKEDMTMFQQLVSRQYRYDKGLFRLESKDEFLTRVGTEEFTSPDRADAVALAFYPHAHGGMTTAST